MPREHPDIPISTMARTVAMAAHRLMYVKYREMWADGPAPAFSGITNVTRPEGLDVPDVTRAVPAPLG
jgi:hypothetical protein